MDELRSIRIFLTVARLRSFAAAARQLTTTPASVTRSVSALETRLGVQLLVRTTRQVSLTSAGAIYAARVTPLVEEFDRAADEIRSQEGVDSGRIRINAPMSIGLRVLPDLLDEFERDYPQVDVSVTMTDQFVDILETDFDLAIRVSGPPDDKSTIWRKVCPVERVLVTAPGTRHVSAETPEDLPREACYAYSPDGREETWELTRDQRTRSLRAGQSLSSNNGDLLAQMVARRGGIALLPKVIVSDAIDAGILVQILDDWSPPDIWLTLYYPPYDRLPPRIAAFSDFFERHVTVTKPLSPASDGRPLSN